MVVHVEPERTEQERRHVGLFRETAEAWPGLGLYARFEQAVALALTFLVSCVIVVAIANQEPRRFSERSRFAQLLRHPSIGRVARDPEMHYAS